MDPVTALSGSGPAYVFLLVEAMAAAGAKLGLTTEMAMQLARATVAGSGELLRQSAEPAAQLRVNVTSPGGTTAAALKVLMADDGIQQVFDKALAAAVAPLARAGGMSEARQKALDAFLALIAEKGMADVSLREIAAAAGLGVAELYALFPDKVSLAAAFMARIDAEVLEGTQPSLDPDETARDRLFDVMMRRYDALRPHRAALRAIRRAGMRDPILTMSLGPALRRSMRAMLEAAAIASDGLSGAARQNGLIAIHYAVSRVFDKDESQDLSATMAALDRRLKMAEKWAEVFERYTKSPRAKQSPEAKDIQDA